MKKLCFVLIAVSFLMIFVSCGKKEEPEAVEPEETATPEPTVQIIDMEAAEPTPSPEPVYYEEPKDDETVMTSYIMSDADMDIALCDELGSKDGISVVSNEFEGQIIYYIIPENDSTDVNKAIGNVIVTMDENCITEARCSVFMNDMGKNKEKFKTVFEFFRDEFPLTAVCNIGETVWNKVKEEVPMDFDDACSKVSTGIIDETKEVEEEEENVLSFGKFSYSTNRDSATFTFKA